MGTDRLAAAGAGGAGPATPRARRRWPSGHYAWVERTFGPFLAETSDPLLRPKLIALTDVFTWKLLGLDLGLDRTGTASALASMIRAVIGDGGRP